jgi:hypothetical protein
MNEPQFNGEQVTSFKDFPKWFSLKVKVKWLVVFALTDKLGLYDKKTLQSMISVEVVPESRMVDVSHCARWK